LPDGRLISMQSGPISSISIAGAGIVGWSAAAAIRKSLPSIAVTVFETGSESTALAERISCTLPSIVDFHSDIGLDDSNVIARAGSAPRLGTRFAGWARNQPDYIHAYGEYGSAIGTAAFHQHWLRAVQDDQAESFDSYCVAAEMARAGKFIPPAAAEASLPQRFAYGLHIDPLRYREMMRAYALHLGARAGDARLKDVRVEPNGGAIQTLGLADGREATADLYVDAGGSQSPLRRAMGGHWEDWSYWLQSDRVIVGASAAPPQVLDVAETAACGWTWSASGSVGAVYASGQLSDREAGDLISTSAADVQLGDPISLSQGRWAEPWVGNCVAIGDSAVAVEPLEWTNLHLAHSAIDRLVAMMPDRSFNPVELWDYNRQVAAEADRVRDFLIAHYVAGDKRSEPFWTVATALELPPSLAHTLTQFRERGRFPFYEEETFSRSSWLAVLIGEGVRPRRVDPLVDTTPREQSARLLAEMQRSISQWVESLPDQAVFLESFRQKVA
jgi:tryptophan halogenase